MCFADQNPKHLMRDIERRMAPVAQAWNEDRKETPVAPGLFAKVRDVLSGWMRKGVRT